MKRSKRWLPRGRGSRPRTKPRGLRGFESFALGGAALGAFGVGIIESFASFQSSTLKDVIVFSLLIPVLLWRSLASQHSEEEVEE